MRLVIQQDAAATAKWIAKYVLKSIEEANPCEEAPFVLATSNASGGDCLNVFAALVDEFKSSTEQGVEVSFEHVKLVCLAEYVGIPPSHAKSHHSLLWHSTLRHLDFQPQNVFIPDGNTQDVAKECARFEHVLSEHPMDLCLVDTGVEGEVGMNGASASLTSRTREFVLTQDTRMRLASQFDGIDNVPRSCVTAGVGTIMEAREVLAIFSGIAKAHALEHCIENPINHMFPLSILQKHMCALVVVDEDATSELRTSTVKYFKGLQQTLALVTKSTLVNPHSPKRRKSTAGAVAVPLVSVDSVD